MPIPALSKSYKQFRSLGAAQVFTMTTEDATPTIVDLTQPEAASQDAHVTKTSGGQGPTLRTHHSRPSSYHSDVDGAKRRSLLPQPGQARHVSQDAAASQMDTVTSQPAPQGRLRPRSMYQPSTLQSTQSRAEDQPATSRSMRPPAAISKPSEPQATGLGRPKSLRRPGTLAQPAQPPSNGGHSRTKSASSTSGLRSQIANAESSSARPRSLLVAPGGHAKSQNLTAEPAPAPAPEPIATRSSARLAGLSRTASIKTRSDIADNDATVQSISRLDDPQQRHRGVAREEAVKTAKPAFSTLQQHFTPRKTGKAPTSTFLHPPPASGANALAPEIVSLQSELLQLHLMHAGSAAVTQQWHVSARRILHKKFDEVANLHQTMLEHERAGREQNNLHALIEWSTGTASAGLIEQIQVLSGPLHELPSLLESGGRYERLTNDFESWLSHVQRLWSARDSASSRGVMETIEGLGNSWTAEHAVLSRKVTSFERDLEQVRQPLPGSSIACLVDACRELVRGLSAEMHTMQAIETVVLSREKEWVEARLQAIAQDPGSALVAAEDEVAAWRC
ncbi:hypothetical protein ACEQ8H_002551 [Pleosporales sp. CAS-2024a]